MSDSIGSNPQRANTNRQTEYCNTEPYSTIKVPFLCVLQKKKKKIMEVDTRFAS